MRFKHVSNAKKHIGVHPLLTTDLKSFFPSTSKAIVFNFFFKKLLCSPDVSELLSNLCTYNNHIPTGSRISMPLAYWANSKMFLELNALSKALGICMSLKFNAHHARNSIVVPPHIWHSGQCLEKCLKCVGIMVCLSFTKFQERIVINPGEVVCCPFSEFIHDVSVFFVLQYPAVIASFHRFPAQQ